MSDHLHLSGGRRAVRVLLVLTCLGALLAYPGLAGADTVGPADLPATMPGDRLLVSHGDVSGMALHTVDLDGGDRTVLTSGGADFGGVWSPDGRHIAFLRVESPSDGLYVVASDGGTPRRLADWGASPSWSPDGTRIVHSPARVGANRPLHIADLAGGNTPIPGTEGGIDPAWSPEGNQIAYIDSLRQHALVMVSLDGSSRTVVPGPMAEPTWSPTWNRLAYLDTSGDNPRLLLIDSAGGESFFLTDRFPVIQQLAYSPTGTHIAFAAGDARTDLDLWTIRVADGQLRRLTSTAADDFHPAWSASASWIMFSRTSDISRGDVPVDVHVVPSAGGTVQRVTDTGSDHAVEFAPGRTLRLSGRDRVATSVALSRTFPAAHAVVIARADTYPDALAGAPFAAALDAPMLLTARDRLSAPLTAEIDRLGADVAYLLGGDAALSPRVATDLRAAGVTTVTRLSGRDRFATAAVIADELADVAGEPARVYVVEGMHADRNRGWPDALSASGLAVHTGEPILLVTRDDLPAATADALAANAAARVTIVGGTAAVSDAVAASVAELVAGVDRVAGADRYATGSRVADLAGEAGASLAHPWLATGRDWPDALAAAPATARDGGFLLLVDGRAPTGSPATHTWLEGRGTQRGVVVGGLGALTAPVRAAIEGSMRGAP
jgi:Tol biopolymer transport system component